MPVPPSLGAGAGMVAWKQRAEACTGNGPRGFNDEAESSAQPVSPWRSRQTRARGPLSWKNPRAFYRGWKLLAREDDDVTES
jgi:hypothetical protein